MYKKNGFKVKKSQVSNRNVSMFLIYSLYCSNVYVYGARGEEFKGISLS